MTEGQSALETRVRNVRLQHQSAINQDVAQRLTRQRYVLSVCEYFEPTRDR